MARPSDRTGKTGSEELARVVRERREELGLSRQELADATGIPYPTIAQIETAYRGVSPARLGVIARALGLDPKELFEVLASQEPAASVGAASTVAQSPPAREGAGFRAAGPVSATTWHSNPRFAPTRSAVRPVPVPPQAAAPSPPAAGSAEPSAAAPAGRAAGKRPADSAGPDPVVAAVVELLSRLPVDQRIEALGQVQSRVLERMVEERADRGR